MSVAKNPITGDLIQTKNISEQYRNNYDLIFGSKVKSVVKSETEEKIKTPDSSEHDK